MVTAVQKRIVKMFLGVIILAIFFLQVVPVVAVDENKGTLYGLTKAGKALGGNELINHDSTTNGKPIFITYVGNAIASALAITGIIFFILTLYAGLRWMLARGDEDAITTARKIIIAAVVGLIIIMGSYALTQFVMNSTGTTKEKDIPPPPYVPARDSGSQPRGGSIPR